jgi:hypothetical protein
MEIHFSLPVCPAAALHFSITDAISDGGSGKEVLGRISGGGRGTTVRSGPGEASRGHAVYGEGRRRNPCAR